MDRNASHCHFYGCDTTKTFAFDTNGSSVITGVTMLIQDLRMETYCSRDSTLNGSIDHHCEYANVHSITCYLVQEGYTYSLDSKETPFSLIPWFLCEGAGNE